MALENEEMSPILSRASVVFLDGEEICLKHDCGTPWKMDGDWFGLVPPLTVIHSQSPW